MSGRSTRRAMLEASAAAMPPVLSRRQAASGVAPPCAT
jgi:hypothetical protein